MAGDLELPSGSALRSNPTQYKNLADDFEERRSGARLAAAKLRGAGSNYATHHSGPDIDVISTGLAQIADAYYDRVSGYSTLSDAFETTYKVLVRLEERSETLDRERFNLRSSEIYGDLAADVLNDAAELVDEFDAIREAERSALAALGNAISLTTFGEDISYDSAAWNEIIGRAIANTDDPEFQVELRASWVTIADHADDGIIDEDGIPDETSEKVVEARINGRTSEEAGLPAVLFPPGYDDDIERLREVERDAHGNIPWLGNPSDEERAEATQIREKLGLDGDREVTRIQIISDTADLHGADVWKGEQLSDVYEESLVRFNNDFRPPVTELSDEAIGLLGVEVSGDPDTSVGFFNELGARNTAELPSVLDDELELIAPFSESLAVASHQDGDPKLAFTGAEVINAAVPNKNTMPPEILFAEGDFETGFLAEATQASIERRDGGELPSWTRDFNGDPTNIMLARASGNPESVQQVVDGLEDKDLTYLLVEPEVGYDPASDGSEPIADFLGVAGGHKDTATVLLGSATEAAEFSDPGVAAGFDRIMGQHATVMYDESFLAEHGIDPASSGSISQEEWLTLGFSSRDWEKLQEKAHEHGQGFALVSGNDELIRQAVAYDLQPDPEGEGEGKINNDYTRFGLTSGVLERNYVEGVIDYEAQIDADSEEYNRLLGTGRSTALFLTGFVPGGRPVVDGVVGAADIVATHIGAESELGLERDTDSEKKKLGELLDEYMEDSAKSRFGQIAQVEAIRAAEMRAEEASAAGLPVQPVVDKNGNPVRLVETDAGTQIEVRNDAGEWDVSSPDWDYGEQFPEGTGTGQADAVIEQEVGEAHEAAAKAADPTPELEDQDEIDETIVEVNESDIWAPIIRDQPEPKEPPINIITGPSFLTGG